MYGLTVRWSLAQAPAGTLDKLRDYVAEDSFTKFEALEGLHTKTWRARDGEWFEGTYVFESQIARENFQMDFQARASEVPGTAITGIDPIIEPFEVVALAVGPAGPRSAPRFEARSF